jgi:hypothetical protein
VKSKLRDLPRFPLRDHATPERIERGWRRLAPELGARPFLASPQTWWAPAALVAVFGAGVFVGSRWVHPEAAPVASAERPPSLEPAGEPQAPNPTPTSVASTRPRSVPSHRRSAAAVAVVGVPSAPKLVPPTPATVLPAVPPEWERLAESGDFAAARASLEAAGGFDSVVRTASAAELMTLVDIARASGSRERAVAALRRVVGVFREAPEAPLAAWTLGNLLDQAGDETAASEAYALYRRLSPGGDFAEDALAREVDAALSQGNLELSARLIAQYENEFPNGRSLEEFRSELARRSERALGTTIAEGASLGEAEASPAPDNARIENAPAKSRADDAPGAVKVAPK